MLDADESETKLSNKIERLIEHNVCNSRSTLVNDLLTMSHHAKYLVPYKGLCSAALSFTSKAIRGMWRTYHTSSFCRHKQRGSAHEGQLNADLIAVYSRLFYAKYRSLLIKKINPTLIMPGGRTYQLRHKLGFMYDSIKRFYGTTQYVSF